jgi:hypothetical protein
MSKDLNEISLDEKGIETFVPMINPKLEKAKKRLKRATDLSRRAAVRETMRFGGTETYGSPFYEFFLDVTNYCNNAYTGIKKLFF